MTEQRIISIDTHREGITRIHGNIGTARMTLVDILHLQEPVGAPALLPLVEKGLITLSELRILTTRKGFMEDKKDEIENRLADFARFEWNRLALQAQHLLMTSVPEAIPLVLVVGDYLREESQDLIANHPFRTTSPEWQDLFRTAELVAASGGTVTFPTPQAGRSILTVSIEPGSNTPGTIDLEVRNARNVNDAILGHNTPVQIARAMLNPTK